MRILFLYSGGRGAKKKLVETGQAPSEFYYGYWELQQAGCEVDFVDVREQTVASISSRFLNIFYYRWQVLPCRATGDLLVLLYRLISKINNYDVVVATTTGIGFCLEILRAMHYIRRPVVTIHCGILNYVYNLPTNIFTRYLLQRSHSQVFGVGEFEGMRKTYSLDQEQIGLNEFGVDRAFWYPEHSSNTENYILSVGNCGRRDYDILSRVAGNLDVSFKLLTDVPPDHVPDNVELLRGRLHSEHEVPDVELRELYRRATLVYVPLMESLQPSGQSVTLQAMACGAPVVLTQTAGIWNRSLLRNHYNCRLVPVGDVAGATTAIRDLIENPERSRDLTRAALETVRDHWDVRQFAKRVYQLCEQSVTSKLNRSSKD